jgi:hypothetical protein
VLPKALRAHLAFVWCQEECTTDTKKLAPAGIDGRERKPLLLKELRRVWQRWPQWSPHSTLLVDDDPIKCERNPPHTAIHPAKWRALRPPDGSELELAPHGALATYLEALHAAPDTQARLRPIERRGGSWYPELHAHAQAHVAANIYVPPGAAGAGPAAADGEHSDHH